jgi:endonuclease IV
MNKNKLHIGGHVSISGGLHKAFEYGDLINCTAIQIFTKSNRQWYAKPISDEDAILFKNAFKNSSIKYEHNQHKYQMYLSYYLHLMETLLFVQDLYYTDHMVQL